MDNIFAVELNNSQNLNSIESIYFNAIYSENLILTIRNQSDLSKSVKINFVLNMPGDESIIETKLYF